MAKISLTRIRELITAATESGAAEVEIEEKGVRIVVRQQTPPLLVTSPYMLPGQPAMMPSGNGHTPGYQPSIIPPLHDAAPESEPPPASSPKEEQVPDGTTVRAPIVGTFFRRPSPDADAFVEVGDTVAKGDTLCIIEAMKNMNEIESDVAGTVGEILVEDGEAVPYDQPLFVII